MRCGNVSGGGSRAPTSTHLLKHVASRHRTVGCIVYAHLPSLLHPPKHVLNNPGQSHSNSTQRRILVGGAASGFQHHSSDATWYAGAQSSHDLDEPKTYPRCAGVDVVELRDPKSHVPRHDNGESIVTPAWLPVFITVSVGLPVIWNLVTCVSISGKELLINKRANTV